MHYDRVKMCVGVGGEKNLFRTKYKKLLARELVSATSGKG